MCSCVIDSISSTSFLKYFIGKIFNSAFECRFDPDPPFTPPLVDFNMVSEHGSSRIVIIWVLDPWQGEEDFRIGFFTWAVWAVFVFEKLIFFEDWSELYSSPILIHMISLDIIFRPMKYVWSYFDPHPRIVLNSSWSPSRFFRSPEIYRIFSPSLMSVSGSVTKDC